MKKVIATAVNDGRRGPRDGAAGPLGVGDGGSAGARRRRIGIVDVDDVAGIAAWEVVAIALVAVAIGAVGTYLAQRTHRQAETSSVSMA